jgi:RNA polymerase sigma-70 factor (ECF subfamily)
VGVPSEPLALLCLGLGVPHDPSVEEPLQRWLAEAISTCPQARLSIETFIAHVATKLDAAEPIAPALARLRGGDLWLACAAAHQDAAALAIFDQTYIAGLDVPLRALGLAPFIDEVQQQLRVKLVLPGGNAPSELLGYAGRGELRGWLRTAAVRAGLKLAQRERRDAPLDDDFLLALPTPGDDPEIERLKSTYAVEFNNALREAMKSLAIRDRNLLRQHFIDGLTVDQLGAHYSVHRATAARWVAAARATLLHATEVLLMARLRVGGDELQSILRLVRSRLDLTTF